MARQQSHSPLLNLHELHFEAEFVVQEEVEELVDNFVTPYLTRKSANPLTLKIIVGKGLHSHHFIDGKNPLRYYTEEYLNATNLNFRNAPEHEGGRGVILVDV